MQTKPQPSERRVALGLACQMLFLAAMLARPHAVQAKLDIVATTPDLAAIAHEIAGDQAEITTLTKPTEDPHFVDAKPSFIVKLNRAEILLQGGADLEIGWLPELVNQARNPKIVPGAAGHVRCNDGIRMLEIPVSLDRSRGDIHAAGNPHYLMDPLNARIVAEHIAETLAKRDAAAAETYRDNLKKFVARLEAKLAEWQKRLAPYKGQHFVSYHNSWIYFAERFKLQSDLYLEPKPGIPPTPAHLAQIVARMKQGNVRVVLVEPYQNRRTAERIAGNTGAILVNVSQFPGGVKGTEAGYIQLMDYLVDALARAFAGKAN